MFSLLVGCQSPGKRVGRSAAGQRREAGGPDGDAVRERTGGSGVRGGGGRPDQHRPLAHHPAPDIVNRPTRERGLITRLSEVQPLIRIHSFIQIVLNAFSIITACRVMPLNSCAHVPTNRSAGCVGHLDPRAPSSSPVSARRRRLELKSDPASRSRLANISSSSRLRCVGAKYTNRPPSTCA